jgi:cytosine/adenosine deaminase-related metal-dependent hydrolase
VETIDATGMIVMPGFVDSHRHIWEGILRNIGTDVPLEGRTSYISFVLHKLAPAFRPEDAYVGNLVSALGAIDAGITTLLDWSHIQGSPAHTDAVVRPSTIPGCGPSSPTGSPGGENGRSANPAGS